MHLLFAIIAIILLMIKDNMLYKYTAQAGKQTVWWCKAEEKIIVIFQYIL